MNVLHQPATHAIGSNQVKSGRINKVKADVCGTDDIHGRPGEATWKLLKEGLGNFLECIHGSSTNHGRSYFHGVCTMAKAKGPGIAILNRADEAKGHATEERTFTRVGPIGNVAHNCGRIEHLLIDSEREDIVRAVSRSKDPGIRDGGINRSIEVGVSNRVIIEGKEEETVLVQIARVIQLLGIR